jgi:hypothetical protein
MDNGKKERVDNGNVRCCDCEVLHRESGTCDAGAEALAELGYPLVAYRPEQTSSARRCPSFEPTEECQERMLGESSPDLATSYGVKRGIDFPASL